MAAINAIEIEIASEEVKARSTCPASEVVCETPARRRWSRKIAGPTIAATTQVVTAPASSTNAWAPSSRAPKPD